MKQLFRYSFLMMIVLVAAGCSGSRKIDKMSPEDRYARATTFYEKERWSRASDDFRWVVLNNPAGANAADAQFFFAECKFNQKMYVEAQVEYERLMRRWADSERYELARFRIVQCLVNQSPSYFYDQFATQQAVDEIQVFIDEFPDSEYRDDAEKEIQGLRHKVARKTYESGRQYLKWGRPEAAKLYFEQVLTDHYDSPYTDDARIGILVGFIIAEDIDGGAEYLKNEIDNFSNMEKFETAMGYLESARTSKFDLAYYTWLYR